MNQIKRSNRALVVLLSWTAAVAVSSAQTFTSLVSFPPGLAINGLVQGSDGNFYGTSQQAIFELTPSGAFTKLYGFSGVGLGPHAGLVQAADGNFYGTTNRGGASAKGTVFKIAAAGALTTIYTFGTAPTDGANPSGALIQASDGNLYGTTAQGGLHNAGTVFKISLSGTLTTLYAFAITDGHSPLGALVQGTDGNFYGTTGAGGSHLYGTVFKISPAGTLTTLHNFSGTMGDGSEPYAGLIQARDENLYGTTLLGGATGHGTVFKTSPAGELTILYSFGSAPADGSGPEAALVQGADGNFYGTTTSGGSTGAGTIFEVTPAGAPAILHSFNGLDGTTPLDLIQGADGKLYGITTAGGAQLGGTAFSLSVPASTPPLMPSISSGGIVPVNGIAPVIQPGEWVSIYGTNLASATATWNGDFPLALDDTSVMIDGKPAYLWYVSPTQINLQAPDDTATGSVPVVVTTANGSVTAMVTLAQFGPSFLLLDSKHVTGIILRRDGTGAYGGGTYDVIGPTGTSLGYPTVAAKAGDTVELFGIGFGPTTPAVHAGQAFSGSAPTNEAVKLTINNVSVAPSYAGLTGAGLYQLNVTVPASLGSGDVPLVASVGRVMTPAGVVMTLQ